MALVSRSSYTGKVLHWFTLFMVAPIIVPVFNITLFIFPFLAYRFKRAFGFFFRFRPAIHLPALGFIIGAVSSTIYSTNEQSSLQVLPNYIYWALLIMFLSSHSRNIDFNRVAKSCFWGICVVTLYYFFQYTLPGLPILGRISPNGYSFILICFTPLAIYHLLKTKGKFWALTFLAFLSFILLFEGRRAGLVLVGAGGILTIYAYKITLKQLLIFLSMILILLVILSSEAFEKYIQSSNDRIYGLIYNTDEIRKTDVSYLIRVAMVKKGLKIYEERPYTGVGLNNFTKYTAEISSDFEGSHLVLGEKTINTTSAHNSYISLLAEGGLFTFVPFLMILSAIIIKGVFSYNSLPEILRPVLIGLLLMCIHLYFISAILNVFAWFLIGLGSSILYRK